MDLSKVTHMRANLIHRPSNLLVIPDCCVGVEIEVEGEGAVRQARGNNYWKVIRDGSLRNHGLEVVLREPTLGQALIDSLDELQEIINDAYADYSHRTSVHVHLDIRDMTVEQLFNMLFYYFYCEKAIFNYVGQGREENNYCIPWWKTEELKTSLYRIYSAMKEEDSETIRHIINDNMNKYSALNLKVINQFGSVEFRHHYGTHDKNRLLEWINIILSLKKQALTIDHEHISFEEMIQEHFQVPEPLVPYMTEPVTNKGMAFLNEIYHDCQLHTKQLNERETLRKNRLHTTLTREHLQQLDAFNRTRDLPTLSTQRNIGDITEEEVLIMSGGSTVLIDVNELIEEGGEILTSPHNAYADFLNNRGANRTINTRNVDGTVSASPPLELRIDTSDVST